jgi:glycosyltransferase involved in cell wall biosynthesis
LKIDIIICTYNRPQKVLELVHQLNTYSSYLNSIIVVDSSDIVHEELSIQNNLHYLRTVHKNQPFQRYMGYKNSQSDILIFLDDDMEVANPDFLQIIGNVFQDGKVNGMAIKFADKHKNNSLDAIPVSNLLVRAKSIKFFFGWFTGYPVMAEGKLGLCGIKGKQPANGGNTEWLSGGAFAVRRDIMFKDFNFQLFDIFEKKIGMGEDAIIGYGISRHGILLYHPDLLFYHNDQNDSTYSVDHFSYARRVTFSRLYLSLEKSRLNGDSIIRAYLHYHWYVLWRIVGLSLNLILKGNPVNKRLLKGTFEGWKLACTFRFKLLQYPKSFSKLINQ